MAYVVNGVDLVAKAALFKTAHNTTVATSASDHVLLANTISNTDPAALDSLSEIVAAFQANDGQLTNAINALGTSSSSNFAAVNARVDAEITARQTADAAINSALAAEVTRATAADALAVEKIAGIDETLASLLS